MSILQGAANTTISGGTYVAAASGSTVHIHQPDSQYGTRTNLPSVSRTVGSQELSAHAAHTALYNSSARFDAPRCHRNTRASYLDRLERWMLGHSQEYADARLIWLTGGAGAGRSAILQSIVERTAQSTTILGTFFFSRADPSRNYAEVLIPTLAYQLGRAFPAAAAVLDPIIERDPLIFKASLQTQTHELLVRPLLHLLDTGAIAKTSPKRLLLVIDGLDECDDPRKQALIIHVITGILCDHQLPVSFLIASRPEVAISQAFQRASRAHPILETIPLDANHEAKLDICQFIEDSFLDIRETHPLRDYIPLDWPSQHSINRLVQKSSGHFIYAATAMKYISSGDEHPERALRVIEGLDPSRTGNPFAELDTLYTHIITSARYRSEVLWILRHCCSGYFANTVAALCFMRIDYSPEDIVLFLSDMHAIVSVFPDGQAKIHISLKHASLSEFLYNKQRSDSLYVALETHFTSLLPRYFGMLDFDPKHAAPLLMQAHDKVTDITSAWTIAIRGCSDRQLLQSFLSRHPPLEVWALSKQCVFLTSQPTVTAISMVSSYLRGIRESAANSDNALYPQQLAMFLQNLLDDSNPHYHLLPALLDPPNLDNFDPVFLINDLD